MSIRSTIRSEIRTGLSGLAEKDWGHISTTPSLSFAAVFFQIVNWIANKKERKKEMLVIGARSMNFYSVGSRLYPLTNTNNTFHSEKEKRKNVRTRRKFDGSFFFVDLLPYPTGSSSRSRPSGAVNVVEYPPRRRTPAPISLHHHDARVFHIPSLYRTTRKTKTAEKGTNRN